MNANASSNLNQILTSFQNFILTYENPLWVKDATTDDIKTAFKLGSFIEKAIHNFKSKECLPQLSKLLETWCKQKYLKLYSEDFFALANDQLLAKVFKFVNAKETTLDICVRVYTSIYPKERFKNFLQNLILMSSSVSAITDFVNLCVSDTTEIENSIILSKWNDYFATGQKNAVKSEIESYLSLYKVEVMLSRMVSILALNENISAQEKDVQNLILECILEKMLDRSILSKNFWLTLFKKVKIQDISKACVNFKAFLESLFSFIEYVGSMLKKDSVNDLLEWKSDSGLSLYPEINYFNILGVLKSVCGRDPAIREYIVNRLDQAQEHSNSALWKELKSEISELF